MSLIQCSECKKELSDKAPICPHCGAPNTATVSPKAIDPNVCRKCGTNYITELKPVVFSPVSLVTLPMFLFGLSAFLWNWLAALIIIGIALLIDHFGRSKKTVMVCPNCRYKPT